MRSYESDYRRSIEQPAEFWLEQAHEIDWFEFPQQGLSQDAQGHYRWFEGGKLNTSYLALDYHVENGRADQPALIYDSPVTGKKQIYTYRELRDEVAKTAGFLRDLGLQKGDTAIVYMPMIPQALMAMLACARLGVVHSVVFGGFAAPELAIRIDDAKPKVILAASGGVEISRHIAYKPIIDHAIDLAEHKPETVVVYKRPGIEAELQEGRDYDWETLFAQAEPADYVPLEATDPLYILYTSGTTGKPKGIVRDNGGYAVAMKYSMRYVYDIEPGDVYWAASDVGWVVGHSYIVYGPLIHGCTTIVFEGKPIKTPDPGTFWRVIQEYNVRALFTAPTAIRAIKKEDPSGIYKAKYDLPSLKYLFLAGERCDVATYEWAKDTLGVPVIDHWWQTESGWAMLANMAGYGLAPVKPGSASRPVCGYDLRVLDPDGAEVGPNEEGAVVIKLPLPPGCLPNLWNDNERFVSSYLSAYPGYYLAGDGGYKDEDGYVFITGRIDDVINVAGHRLSTSDMEEVVAAHPAVAECAVIGIEEALKGQVPVGFVVLKEGVMTDPAEIEAELVDMVRKKVGPIACFRKAIVVSRLPKTRSGKILRKTMRFIADGKKFTPPSTIEDPTVLVEIEESMKEEHIGVAFA
ncbi:MAG: propionyl-CoA synthetase [Bacteroidetes bacterium]|nr:MAG: propionyl-CoA synthetase [Bacteroidota bacterium]